MAKSTGEIIKDLIDAFHWYSLPRPAAGLYVEKLGDLPAGALEFAVNEVICTETRYFPSIGLLRSIAASHTLALPSPTGALAQIQDRITWAHTDEDTRGDAPLVHPTVKQALDLVGGFAAFRTAEESTIIRGQFLRLYKELREDTIHEATAGRLALPPAA